MKGHSVLVIAAHGDDEVLGCGGTLARWAAEGATVNILLLADGETSRTGVSDSEAQTRVARRNEAAEKACAALGAAGVESCGLPDNRLDGLELLDIVKLIEEIIARHQPRTVLTHHDGDVNVDHRVTHEAVLAACRPQPGHPVRELLFFEVLSSTEWRPAATGRAFRPNTFVDISGFLEKKLDALRAYGNELRPFPHPRSLEAVEALVRWRGSMCGASEAEAFVSGRELIP